MKRLFKHEHLPWLTLLCAAGGLGLRLWLLSTRDEMGFVLRGHISELLLVGLTLLFLAVLALACRSLRQANKYSFNFPPSITGGIGSILAAGGLAITALSDYTAKADSLSQLCALVGLMSAAALVFCAFCRARGQKPHFLIHAVLCLYLMVKLIFLYRQWSADPELEDYVFQILAVAAAMLSAYHRCAFDADTGSRAQYAFFSMSAIYFCLVSLSGPGQIVPYLALSVWLLTDLCCLVPMSDPQENEQ